MARNLHQPPLPLGAGEKHHIVVLESIHAPMPTFSFPHTITLHPRTSPPEVAARIRDATIVIACVTPVTPADIEQAPRLGCIAIMAVGIGWLDREYCAQRGLSVTNCRAGNVDAVGEHFLALYFGVRKRVPELCSAVTASSEWVDKGTLTRRWVDGDGVVGPPPGCRQEVLGVLGYGNLGKRIEQLCKAVGFGEVLVSERKGQTLRRGRTPFEEVIKRASTIVVCVPKEGDTVDLIDEPELAMMRKDAIVINVARGGIVNEAALARALKERRIAGAATDVMETEPGGPGTSPLIPDTSKGEEPVPNLTISPHIAWFTQSTIANYQRMLKEGVEDWVNGDLGDDKVKDFVVVHDGKNRVSDQGSNFSTTEYIVIECLSDDERRPARVQKTDNDDDEAPKPPTKHANLSIRKEGREDGILPETCPAAHPLPKTASK